MGQFADWLWFSMIGTGIGQIGDNCHRQSDCRETLMCTKVTFSDRDATCQPGKIILLPNSTNTIQNIIHFSLYCIDRLAKQ